MPTAPRSGGRERLAFPAEDASIFLLWQKLERKTLSLLTLISNRFCSRLAADGKDKVAFRYKRGRGLSSPGGSPNSKPRIPLAGSVHSQILIET